MRSEERGPSFSGHVEERVWHIDDLYFRRCGVGSWGREGAVGGRKYPENRRSSENLSLRKRDYYNYMTRMFSGVSVTLCDAELKLGT